MSVKPHPRFGAALKLIEKRGIPVKQAMLAVGYKGHSAKAAAYHNPNMREQIVKAQERYALKVFNEIDRQELSPELTVGKLKEAIVNGTYRDATNAIKTHYGFILQAGRIYSYPDSVGNISVTQNFITPPVISSKEWDKSVHAILDAETVSTPNAGVPQPKPCKPTLVPGLIQKDRLTALRNKKRKT